MSEYIADALVGLATRVTWALLESALVTAAVVAAALALGHIPMVTGTRPGRWLADAERGARRLFLTPASKIAAGHGPGWKPTAWAVAALAVAATSLGAVLLASIVIVGCWAAGRVYQRTDAWWSHSRLVRALIDSGVLRAPRSGEPLPSVSYRGRPRHTDHGTDVAIGLPAGVCLADVAGKRERLAAAMRVPAARLEVTQRDDDPAGVVRLHVAHDGPGTGVPVGAVVGAAPSTTWSEPVRIGRDTRGEPVELATYEANTLIAGIPGSGKTSLARVVLAHYLLDPAARVFALDGKGSGRDYGAARPLCARFVSGTDEDAVESTIEMLDEVLRIVRERNSTGGEAAGGVLVLLEELQDVRTAADRGNRDRLDTTLGRITRMGRAVDVSVLISTQRPSIDDLPSGVRNLIGQRVALQLRNAADAALVLGTAPPLALPRGRGQALYATPAGVRAVHLDRLTDDAWRAVCARAAALRAAGPPGPVAAAHGPAGPPQGAVLASVEPGEPLDRLPDPLLDPLLDAVLAVLDDADPAGLAAAEIHRRLPDWTRAACRDAQALGLELRRHPDALVRTSHGKQRVWRATGKVSASCRRAVGKLSGHVSEAAAEPAGRLSGDCLDGPAHARTAQPTA